MAYRQVLVIKEQTGTVSTYYRNKLGEPLFSMYISSVDKSVHEALANLLGQPFIYRVETWEDDDGSTQEEQELIWPQLDIEVQSLQENESDRNQTRIKNLVTEEEIVVDIKSFEMYCELYAGPLGRTILSTPIYRFLLPVKVKITEEEYQPTFSTNGQEVH